MLQEGGQGSGNFGHQGRPGEVGGSGPGDESDIGNLKIPTAQTEGAITKIGYSGQDDAFIISTKDGSKVTGYVRNADFPGDAESKTRGEIYYLETNESNRRAGIGTSLVKDALHLMVVNNVSTVNMSYTSEGGRGLIEKLIKNGIISSPIRTAKSGKSEYNILFRMKESDRGEGSYNMPYSKISELPEYLKDKAENVKRQWMEVFNSAYKKAIADGLDTDEAEKKAFAMANGVIKKTEEKKQESDEFEEGGKGSGHYGHAGRPGEVGGSADDDVNVDSNDLISTARQLVNERGTQRTGNINWYIDNNDNIISSHFVTGREWGTINLATKEIVATKPGREKDLDAILNFLTDKAKERKSKMEFDNLMLYPVKNQNELKRIASKYKGKDWTAKAKMFIEADEFTFHESARLTEASAMSGKEWEAVLLQVGKSLNVGKHGHQRYYSPEAVKSAVESGMFENKPVTLYKFDKTLTDHVPMDVAESQPEGLFGNAVGCTKNVRFDKFIDEKGQEQWGAIGTIHIYDGEEALRKKLIDMWESKVKIGFSIDGGGSERPALFGGEAVDYVDVISDISENTLVTFPAAGGHAIRLAASETQNKTPIKGETKMLEKLIALIKELRPKLLEGKDLATLTEADAEALLKEAMKPEVVEKVVEKQVTVPDTEGTAKLQAEIQKLNESLLVGQKAVLLDQKLQESNIPVELKAIVRGHFEGKNFDEAALNAELKAHQDAYAKMQESHPNVGQQVKIGSEERDKMQIAMDGMFEGKDLPDKDGKKVKRFISFKEAYATVVGDPRAMYAHPQTIMGDSYWYMPEMKDASFTESYDASRRRALRESYLREGMQTSDWAEILANAINKKMVKEVQNPQLNVWRDICSDISSFTNFQQQSRLHMGGYGVLTSVSERATYQSLTSPGDTNSTFTPAKFGGLEDITMEMVANDDVQSIRQIPVKLGRAAIQTLYRDVFDMFANNLESDDSTTLATAARGNTIATALSTTAYAELRYTMRSLAHYGDTYDILGYSNIPKILLVPNELEDVALRVMNSEVAVSNIYTAGTSHYNTQTEPNVYRQDIKKVLVIDYWTDTNNWWGVADPAVAPTVEVSFYQGREEPELFVQDMPNVGSMFTADKITYKIRYIYGFNVINWRSFGLSIT